jgi:hypothetical protein
LYIIDAKMTYNLETLITELAEIENNLSKSASGPSHGSIKSCESKAIPETRIATASLWKQDAKDHLQSRQHMNSAKGLGSTITKVKLSRLMHLINSSVTFQSREETTSYKKTHSLLVDGYLQLAQNEIPQSHPFFGPS